jgi:hypothetical protein
MARNPRKSTPQAPPAVAAKGAVLSLTFEERDQAIAALLEIDAALASLYVLYDYCEERSLHRTPLLALHAATIAIGAPHARLNKLLDPTASSKEETCHE